MTDNRTGKFYLRKLFTGSLAMTLAEASMKIVKLLVLPILTFYLTPKDFGIIASIKMVEGFLIMIYNPGMISGVSRKYFDTENEEERRTYIGSALLFFLIISIIITSTLLLLGNSFFKNVFNEFELYPYGIVAIIVAMMIQPKRLWSSLMTFRFQVPKVALFSFLQMMIDIGVSLFLVAVLFLGVKGRVIGLILSIVFITIVALYFLLKYIKGHFSLKVAWKLFLFGLPLAPAIWAYSALDIADRFLIGHFVGLEKLGIYSIGYTISSMPLFLSLGLRKMWNPIFYENMNNKKYDRINILIKYFILGIAFVSGSLIIFSNELITIVFAKDFKDAVTIIPWVCSGVFFLGILPITSSFIAFEKRFKKISINAGISAIVNIIINIYLLPRIGIVGSAVATMIAYITYFILNIYTSKKIFFEVVSIKHIIIPMIFVILSVFIYYLTEVSWFYFFIKAIGIIIFMLILYLTKFFTPTEIKALKGMVK